MEASIKRISDGGVLLGYLSLEAIQLLTCLFLSLLAGTKILENLLAFSCPTHRLHSNEATAWPQSSGMFSPRPAVSHSPTEMGHL